MQQQQQQRMPKTRAIEHDKTWQDLHIPAQKNKKHFHSFLNTFLADQTGISIAQLERSTRRMRNERAYAPWQVLPGTLNKYVLYIHSYAFQC